MPFFDTPVVVALIVGAVAWAAVTIWGYAAWFWWRSHRRLVSGWLLNECFLLASAVLCTVAYVALVLSVDAPWGALLGASAAGTVAGVGTALRAYAPVASKAMQR